MRYLRVSPVCLVVVFRPLEKNAKQFGKQHHADTSNKPIPGKKAETVFDAKMLVLMDKQTSNQTRSQDGYKSEPEFADIFVTHQPV
jgi:hypothetical protein